jgi:hypothetical protein
MDNVQKQNNCMPGLVWSILMDTITILCTFAITDIISVTHNFLPWKDDRFIWKYTYSLWDKNITVVHNTWDFQKNEITSLPSWSRYSAGLGGGVCDILGDGISEKTKWSEAQSMSTQVKAVLSQNKDAFLHATCS